MLHDIELQIVVNTSVDVVTEVAWFLPSRRRKRETPP